MSPGVSLIAEFDGDIQNWAKIFDIGEIGSPPPPLPPRHDHPARAPQTNSAIRPAFLYNLGVSYPRNVITPVFGVRKILGQEKSA